MISFTYCKFETTEPVWVRDAPVMPTEQTTRISVTIAEYSLNTLVSQSILRETTAVSHMDPEETTNVFKKGFASTVVGTYSKTISAKEDNRLTTDLKLNNKNTSIPHMKVVPVQTTRKADVTNLNIEDVSKTTILSTTDGRTVILENSIVSEDRANVVSSDIVSKTGLIIFQNICTKLVVLFWIYK